MPKSSRTGDTNSLAASILARHTGQPVPTGLSEPGAAPSDPQAVTAEVHAAAIVVALRSGVELRVPIGLVPDLPADADPELLADVRIADDGARLSWPGLGVKHSVSALLAAVLGLRTAHANGRRGGLKGGHARAAALSPEQRAESARKAAEARWGPKMTELYAEVERHLPLELNGQSLETVWREDGSPWWMYGPRAARIERAFGNLVSIIILDGSGEESPRMTGDAREPATLARKIALGLTP